MKKALSILLSVTLLLTTLWSVLGVGMAASSGTTYFETPANWKFYASGSTIGGTEASPNAATRPETATATYIREGGSSLYLNAGGKATAIKLPNLELNKIYTFSFWYLVPAGTKGTSLNAWMAKTGIYKAGAAVSTYGAIDTSVAVVKGADARGSGDKTISSSVTGDEVFYQYSITFETTKETGTDLYFAYQHFLTGYGSLYLDNFSLVESDYYEMAQNWGYYAGGESLGGTYANAQYVKQDNTTVKNGPSVQFGGTTHAKAPAIKLKNLEAGKTYSVSFWYYSSQLISTTNETTYQLHNIGIYKAGATKGSGNAVIDSDTNKAYTLATAPNASAQSLNTWYQYEFKFAVTATDLQSDLYFALAPWRTNLFYISGFTIEEVSYFEEVTNWKRYTNGTTIGTGGVASSATWGAVKNTDTAYISSGSTSVHINANSEAMGIALPNLAVGNTYTFSFRYFVPTTTKASSIGAWLGDAGIYKSGKATVGSAAAITATETVIDPVELKGAGASSGTSGDATWHNASFTFTVTSDTGTDLHFAFQNWFGNGTTKDLYLDEFKLEETTPPKTDDAYFEDADNWYKLSNLTTDIPADKDDWVQAKSGWLSLGEISDSNVKSGNHALKWYGWNFSEYIPLENLKANRTYTLSFYYKASGVNMQSGSPYIVCDSGIYTTSPKIPSGETKVSGTAYNSDGYILHRGSVTGYTNPTGDFSSSDRQQNSSLRSVGAVANEWNYIEYTFNTYDYDDLFFVLHCKFPNGASEFAYLDEFTLTEHPYEAPDMTWKMHSSATKVFGENATTITYASAQKSKEQNYTGEGNDGDANSYKITGGYAQYPATKISFEKNKYYNLTFYYYGTQLDDKNGMFSHMKLVKEGGEHADSTPDNLAYLDRNTCYYTNQMGAMIKLDGKINQSVKANEWNKVTLSFYSGDNTDAWLALRPTVNSAVYVDNFSLAETTELPKADQAVRLTWKSVSSGTTVFGAGEKAGYGTFEEDETLVCPDAVDDGYSNKLMPNNYAQYATTKIEGLEKNTYYYLTFYYYGSVLGSNKSMFSDAKVVKDGGANSSATPDNLGYLGRTNVYYTNPNGLNAPMTGTTLANATANGWNKAVIPFYSGDNTTAWLALRHTASSTTDSTAPQNAAPIWVDGIKVEKTTDVFPYINEVPFAGWQGTPTEALINFDDYFVSVTPADRAEVTAAPAKDGKENNRALHFIPGVYDSAFRLNDGTINKDLVFTIPVEESSLYKFSYWIYVEKDEGSIPYFGFYYDFDSTWLLRSNSLQERGRWVQRETTFTTKPGMTQISLTINPGEIVRDIYIDDILVKRILPGVMGTAEDASYCDDFYNVIEEQKLTEAIEKAATGVYKVAVEPNTQYTFAATVKSQKGSESKLWLSFDEAAGTALPISETGASEAMISSKGGETRYSYSIVTDQSGYLYIWIDNDDGTMKLEDLQLFRAVSVSTNLPMGFETKQQTKLAVNTGAALNQLTLLGDLPAEDMADGESPATGSQPIWPLMLILVSALILSIFTIQSKKGGEQA